MLDTVHYPILLNLFAYLSVGGFLLLFIILIIYYLHLKKYNGNCTIEEARDKEGIELRYQNSSLDSDAMDNYAKQLDLFLLETQLYLQANLSLDILSRETNIPKHLLSQLFNIHLNKNFFQLMAEYRIAYAIETLNEQKNIKIESLAHDCGYNSKSSFNKYFKQQMGLTPSEYRDTLRQAF